MNPVALELLDSLVDAIPLSKLHSLYQEYLINLSESNQQFIQHLSESNPNLARDSNGKPIIKSFGHFVKRPQSFEQYRSTGIRIHVVNQLLQTRYASLYINLSLADIDTLLHLTSGGARKILNSLPRKYRNPVYDNTELVTASQEYHSLPTEATQLNSTL